MRSSSEIPAFQMDLVTYSNYRPGCHLGSYRPRVRHLAAPRERSSPSHERSSHAATLAIPRRRSDTGERRIEPRNGAERREARLHRHHEPRPGSRPAARRRADGPVSYRDRHAVRHNTAGHSFCQARGPTPHDRAEEYGSAGGDADTAAIAHQSCSPHGNPNPGSHGEAYRVTTFFALAVAGRFLRSSDGSGPYQSESRSDRTSASDTIRTPASGSPGVYE